MAKWLQEDARDYDVVVSTRVRLARNLKNLPFSPEKLTQKDYQTLADVAKSAFLRDGSDFTTTYLKDLSPIKRQSLVEQHIISRELANNKYGALVASPDEALSVMVGEEDHFRLQSLKSGFDLEQAYAAADELDNMLSRKAEIAFDPELGYLTSCPTNVGTGMRASLMLHLPALNMTGNLENVLNTIGKFGMTARGFFGEGTQAEGNMLQISNQVTLGVTEKEILYNLSIAANKIIEAERELRTQVYSKNKIEMEDRIFRSLGALSMARKMTSEEMYREISDVALGISLGMVKRMTLKEAYGLMIDLGAASVAVNGQAQDAQQRDEQRANMLRSAFGNQ